MSLSKISGSLFREEACILTGLPALDEALTDQLGLSRKQVVATVSERDQVSESVLALLIAHNLIRDTGRRVLLLSVASKKEYLSLVSGFEAFGFDDRARDEAVLLLGRHLAVENPRSWTSFDDALPQYLESVEPVMLMIESPDVVLPCVQAWEFVLQKHLHPDPWGSLARRVKALSEQANCPIWVFGELCYSLKFIDHLYSGSLPSSEASWRTCAQLEAYLNYWDCVVELKADEPSSLRASSLKNRLGASFSKVQLQE